MNGRLRFGGEGEGGEGGGDGKAEEADDFRCGRRKMFFAECVLCKKSIINGDAKDDDDKEEEDDFLLCEGLMTNVFVVKRDEDAQQIVVQTAPDADVLPGVARGAFIDSFSSSPSSPSSSSSSSSVYATATLKIEHPRWSERRSWVGLFTVNAISGILPVDFRGVVDAATGASVTFDDKRFRLDLLLREKLLVKNKSEQREASESVDMRPSLFRLFDDDIQPFVA